MKSHSLHSALVIASLLAFAHPAAAQGPAGSGGVASIPGSVVRAGDQRQFVAPPGLISIITGSTPAGSNLDSNQRTTRRGGNPLPPR
jgi:hypothetical protein